MDARIAQGVLRDMLASVCGVIPKTGVNPVYGGVLVTAADGLLSVSASDSNRWVTCTREASVDGVGEVILPGVILSDTVRNMPDKPVTICVRDGRCELSCGRSKMRPVVLESADAGFLRFPQPCCEYEVEVPTDVFRLMADRACKCVSRDCSRPDLCGVHMMSDNGILRMQATDAHRFIDVSTSADIGRFDAIVASLDDIVSSANGDTVSIGTGDGKVFASSGDMTYASRVLLGRFPDFDYVAEAVCNGDGSTVALDPAELLLALKRVGSIAKKAGRVSVRVSGESMVVSATSPAYGETSCEIDVDLDGSDFSAFYAYQIISDGVAVMSGETVMKTSGGTSPLVIESHDKCGTRYLMMPMRG